MTAIEKRVHALSEAIPNLSDPLKRACEELGYPTELQLAYATAAALNLMGIQARVISGSASWVVMGLEAQGDALIENRQPVARFGYRFDITESLGFLSKMEYPPDLHSWCVDGEGVIYDFSGELQADRYKENTGDEWPEGTRLPYPICGQQDDLKANGWFYNPDEQATKLVELFIMRVVAVSMHLMR